MTKPTPKRKAPEGRKKRKRRKKEREDFRIEFGRGMEVCDDGVEILCCC